MRLVKWLLHLVTQNAGWKLLSLAIAVVVWGMVANEPELSTFATVSVEYKNLPENLEISSDPVSTVKLELRGPSGQLRSMGNGSQAEVILDMSRVQPGEFTFPIGDGNVKLVSGVHLVRAIPSEVHFHFEGSVKHTIRVTPRFVPRSGYTVTNFSVTPDSIEAVGPASRMARVDTILTDPVEVPAQAGAFDWQVNVVVGDPFVRFPGKSRVTVMATVKKE